MAEAVVDMRDVASKYMLTLRIKRADQWRWRLKLGLWLIQLAAWVMWVKIEIVMHDEGAIGG